MQLEVINFGCRLNSYESEVIKELFKEQNIELDNEKKIIIFNSCAVTKQAEDQLCQAIRKSKKENKNSIIGVVGCAVQVNKERYLNMPEVDFLLGNNDKLEIANYINFKKHNVVISDVFKENKTSNKLITGFENRVRAFIQIQNGCDNKCTFCLTRLARGYSVSTPSYKIIEQVKKLVDNGFREIVLTGIDISDYGKRLDEKIDLGILVQKILKETSLERLRISSIDIANLNEDLENAYKYEKRLMPHIHLSLQSGDNMILRRMLRRHTREQVLEKCHELKNVRKDLIFGADLIAGFPTETDEMHKNSLKIIQELPITFGHIFPYSERPETMAAKMPQVPKYIRKQRAKELRDEANKNLEKLRQDLEGTVQKVLVEGKGKGRLENYLQVDIDRDYNKYIGEIIPMTV